MSEADTPTIPVGSRWERAILHLDMDAFFVNVHLLDHPQNRGKPLAIGGRPDQRGVVSSASYEARQFGVRSAMPMSQALRLCPELIIASVDWEQVRAGSRTVMSILHEYGPVEPMSVDEAYVDLSERLNPKIIAVQIRNRVKAQTGLPCSVGLATNKLVAKVASDFDKPEGFTIVEPGWEAAFLAPLPTRALLGVGPRTAERLAELGITTCGELAAFNTDALRLTFGKHSESLQRRARGIDRREVQAERGQAKSISQERTFNTDIDDASFLHAKLESMAPKVARSLQKRNLVAHTVSVKFRWADFTTFTRQKSVEVGIDSAEAITRLAHGIFDENWQGEKLRLLGVGVSNLEPMVWRQLAFEFDV
ncbi:MAG: DNA polymerase IV [Anaerolineae bacterium]|nr:DNA polymerase IV [Anaerolineae bacterium]MCO5187200.1 DNA polymerase IV [Anaerolineae bacterium]